MSPSLPTSLPSYFRSDFYEDACRFLTRTRSPKVLPRKSRVIESQYPYNKLAFWQGSIKHQPDSEPGCAGWATIFLISECVVREIAMGLSTVPPSLKSHELMNLLYNVYDCIVEEVGCEVVDKVLSKRLSFLGVSIYLFFCISDPSPENRLFTRSKPPPSDIFWVTGPPFLGRG